MSKSRPPTVEMTTLMGEDSLLVAEPLKLLREFPPKEVAVKHSPGTLELAERFVEGLGEAARKTRWGIEFCITTVGVGVGAG